MSRPTLTVVEGGGKPEPDTAIIDCLRSALKRAEAGELDGVFLALQVTGDPVPDFHIPSDDPLRCVSLVEFFLPDVKAVMLGLGEE